MFSALLTQVAQLEAIIRSAQALLQAGLIDEATSLLTAFSTEVQPNINRSSHRSISTWSGSLAGTRESTPAKTLAWTWAFGIEAERLKQA